MKKSQVIDYFGDQVKTAAALGITQPSVSNWGSIIPQLQAMRVERITGGALKYDPALYSPKKDISKPPKPHVSTVALKPQGVHETAFPQLQKD